MTATGDHGGDSENELNAAMFVYSKHWSGLDMPLQAVNKSKVFHFYQFFDFHFYFFSKLLPFFR